MTGEQRQGHAMLEEYSSYGASMSIEGELPAAERSAGRLVLNWSGVVGLVMAVVSFTVTQQESQRNAQDLSKLTAVVEIEREKGRNLATRDDIRRVEDRVNFLIEELASARRQPR